MDLKTKLQENIKSYSNSGTMLDNDTVQGIIQKTFLWMWWITLIVFLVWYYVLWLLKDNYISAWNYQVAFWASFVVSLLLIVVITFKYSSMKYSTLSILALLFSVSEWVGLAGILAIYSATSVINAFAWAAVLFLMLAIYGYTTKQDLTKFWTLFIVWLITIILLSLLNVFLLHSSALELWLSIVGLLLFLWLTAWDIQILKQMAQTWDRRLEIVFWISLYLNFINIFIELLQIFGSRD